MPLAPGPDEGSLELLPAPGGELVTALEDDRPSEEHQPKGGQGSDKLHRFSLSAPPGAL